MFNGSGAYLNHSEVFQAFGWSRNPKRPYGKDIDGDDRSNDGIKSASKPSRKLQFRLKTNETTGTILRIACGMYDISQ